MKRLDRITDVLKVYFALMLALTALQSQAAKSIRFLAASELQASLLSDKDDIRLSGRNYIMGVVDTLMLTKTSPICMQTETEINQITDLVKLQLAQRPDLLRYNAASVVREVMVANYPCI